MYRMSRSHVADLYEDAKRGIKAEFQVGGVVKLHPTGEGAEVDSPLLKTPNVAALPHIGSATHETDYNMAACAIDNLIAALAG